MDAEARARSAARDGRQEDILEILAEARRSGEVTPQLQIWAGNVHREAGRLPEAEALYAAALRERPGDHIGWFNHGLCLEALGKLEDAADAMQRSLGRPGGHRPSLLRLDAILVALGRPELVDAVRRQAVEFGLLAHVDQRPGHYVPGLRAQPWWSTSAIPELERFDADVIRDEVRAVHEHDELRTWRSPALGQGQWQKLFFGFRGRLDPRHRSRCPTLYALLDALPDLARLEVGNQCLSVLQPHTVVAPHCGPTNTRLRAHLGVEVPPGCELRVGGEVRAWREGEWLVFDDSFEHAANNPSERPRFVLIVDSWHPQLRDAGERARRLRSA